MSYRHSGASRFYNSFPLPLPLRLPQIELEGLLSYAEYPELPALAATMAISAE